MRTDARVDSGAGVSGYGPGIPCACAEAASGSISFFGLEVLGACQYLAERSQCMARGLFHPPLF